MSIDDGYDRTPRYEPEWIDPNDGGRVFPDYWSFEHQCGSWIIGTDADLRELAAALLAAVAVPKGER